MSSQAKSVVDFVVNKVEAVDDLTAAVDDVGDATSSPEKTSKKRSHDQLEPEDSLVQEEEEEDEVIEAELPKENKANDVVNDDDENIGDFMFRERKLFCKMGINRQQVREAIHNNDSVSESQNTDDETNTESTFTQESDKEDGEYEILTQAMPSQCGQPVINSSDMIDAAYEDLLGHRPVHADKELQTSAFTLTCAKCGHANVID